MANKLFNNKTVKDKPMITRLKVWLFTALITLAVVSIPASALPTFTEMGRTIMEYDGFGLIVNLGIHNWVDATTAIMIYNYIAVGLIMLVAAFSGQRSESRFTFIVPLFALLMVWFGWLKAPDQSTMVGTTIALLLLGAFMYVNDMNREKYGTQGPGNKLLTMVFMLIIFQAVMVMTASVGWNVSETASGVTTDALCNGYGYTCDSTGKLDYQNSATAISSVGGASLDIINVLKWAYEVMIAMIMFLVKIVAAVFLFSYMLYLAYPALQVPQVVALLAVIQVVIWAVYVIAFFNWYAKPSYETVGV